MNTAEKLNARTAELSRNVGMAMTNLERALAAYRDEAISRLRAAHAETGTYHSCLETWRAQFRGMMACRPILRQMLGIERGGPR